MALDQSEESEVLIMDKIVEDTQPRMDTVCTDGLPLLSDALQILSMHCNLQICSIFDRTLTMWYNANA